MRDITIAITAASYSGNKGAAAMLQSSIGQLKEAYGSRLNVNLMSVYPSEDRTQCPHDFVKIIPAQPQRILFLAFPCAVLYHIFRWCPPVRKLLLKNKVLKAYAGTDLVVDEAGIAFADSRGFVMNTYSFACAAVPMLLGVPVVKYSQALGTFQNVYNRMLAKLVLPKAELVIARGRSTYENLRSIGICKNVRLCADGAFTMPPNPAAGQKVKRECEKAGFSHAAGLSISSVVAKRCGKAGIDYCGIMAGFIAYLVSEGYQVYMFANAARMHSKKPRNNDLMIGDAVYQAYQDLVCENREGIKNKKTASGGFVNGLFWERREMDAEEIRAYIGQCELLAASRFHAMVFALSTQVPVMLIGWSHKYQEVMEQFGLGEYAADFSSLSLEELQRTFQKLVRSQEEIRRRLAKNLPAVQESSKQNVQYIMQILDQILERSGSRFMNHVINLNQPDKYLGAHTACKMGYALDAGIRANAASGGVVTALLCSMLKNHEIDGAWVVKTAFTDDGRLAYETYTATTIQQICEASSSVYMTIPMMSHIDQLRQFEGRLAVVLTPCIMRAFERILKKDAGLREKIVLKIGLFCSGSHDVRAAEYAMDKYRIPRRGAKRLYYRRGHWRGTACILYEDGRQKDFSYTKSICAYKNAYFFLNPGCLQCTDQFAADADISFGDVWLSEVKKEPVKYTGCVIRTQKAQDMLQRAAAQGDICLRHMSDTQMLKSQKRALTFKYRGRRWNHRLAGWLAVKNQRFSKHHPEQLKRVPMALVYYYMCFIRVLLSW